MCIISRSPTNTVDAITTLVIIHLKESQNCVCDCAIDFRINTKVNFQFVLRWTFCIATIAALILMLLIIFRLLHIFSHIYYYNNHQAIQWGQMLCLHIIRARRFYCYTKPIEKGLVYVMKVQL